MAPIEELAEMTGLSSSDLCLLGLKGGALAVAIVYQFLGISILCDVHLCPVLERLCEELRLSTAIAGATLLAFGSSAPELVIGVCGAVQNQTELSIPTILISAMIAFGAIPPLVVAAVGQITLSSFGVLRDAIAYAIALSMLLYFNSQPAIDVLHAFALTFLYFVYLGFIWWSSRLEADRVVDSLEEPFMKKSAFLELADNEDPSRSEPTTCSSSINTDDVVEALESAPRRAVQQSLPQVDPHKEHILNTDGDEESLTLQGRILAVLSCPFEAFFHRTIPEEPKCAFVVNLLYLAILSEGALYCASRLADLWSINPATAGMTLLAFGGQVPDTIAAIELARSGMPDAAVSQAVASQVINITLGVGLPFFIYSVFTGLPTVAGNTRALNLISMTVFMTIVAYVFVVTPWFSSQLRGSNRKLLDSGKAVITQCRALVLMGIFVLLYCTCIAAVEFGW